MKAKALLATSALVACGALFIGEACAADLGARMPIKAPLAATPVFSWTGCYLGGHVGAGWDRTKFTDPGSPDGFGRISQTITATPGGSVSVDGGADVLGGGQIGCDYQFASNWVIGLAGDFSWTNIKGHGNNGDPFFNNKDGTSPITLSTRTEWLASATGRLGYAWDRVMIYGKGGVAFAHDRYSIQNLLAIPSTGTICQVGVTFVACNPQASTTRTGWTAGAGVEWAFAPNWSMLVEYNHYGFGSKALNFSDPAETPGGGPATLQVKQDLDVVKAGVNYRFGHW